MIPEQRKATAVGGSILQPDGRNVVPLTEDYEVGGIALSDPSAGFRVRVWKAEIRNGGTEIWIGPEEDMGSAVKVREDVDITEVTFSFDQLMREVVTYVAAGQAKIWYFDSITAQFQALNINGMSPFATLDDKRRIGGFLGENDVLIFYLRGNTLYYRAQRDRYQTEYTFHSGLPGPANRIVKCGMDNQYRMHVEIALHEY